MLPTIVAFYVQSFVCVPSLSSPLLLRNYPNFFDYYGSSPMCLSSRNRSNSKAFRHILPCIAPVCKGMHYHKTGVPWQINSTLIIKFSCSEMPYNAEFCKVLSAFSSIVFFLFKTTLFAKYFKMVQFNATCSSQIVVS